MRMETSGYDLGRNKFALHKDQAEDDVTGGSETISEMAIMTTVKKKKKGRKRTKQEQIESNPNQRQPTKLVSTPYLFSWLFGLYSFIP